MARMDWLSTNPYLQVNNDAAKSGIKHHSTQIIWYACPLTWWNWSKWCEKKQADHSQCSEQRQTANHSPDILPPIYHAAAQCCPWLSGSNCSWIQCNPPENKDQPMYIHSKGTCMHCLMYLMRDLNINERFKYHFITFWCFIMIYNIHKAYIV